MRLAEKIGALMVVAGVAAGAVAVQAQAPAAKAKKARVFFIEPKNGAKVESPVHLKFGVENYEIAAVPAGEVKTARPGIGHFHVGIDVACLAPDTTIVKGTPAWVHFGDGKSEFDVQLTPGKHKLSLAIGDDLHKALPGLCTTITVNVTK